MYWLSLMRLATLLRSNVDHQVSPSGRSRESGAVASLVAILFGTGVLLGLGALVIDTGSLLYERRQLQNGADAAALAIAKTCAKAPLSAPCAAPDITNTPSPSPLVALAGANAADQKSDIASVCGSAALWAANPGAFPTVCATLPSPGLVECPITTSTAKYVEVRTSTKTASNSTILPPILAQMLAGGNYSGETVKACSRAGWGPRSFVGPTLPFALSSCEWFKATHTNPPPPAVPVVDDSKYAPPPSSSSYPQYSPFPDSFEQALVLNAPLLPTTDPCYTWQGHDFPGGFGWLDRTPSPDCQAVVDAAGWVGVETGAGAGSAGQCGTTIEGFVGHLVHLPVFNCMSQYKTLVPCDNTANGTHSYYHVVSTVAFFITAFDTASVKKSIDNNHPTNAASDACIAKGGTGSKCVYGWFVKATDSGGEIDPNALDTGDTIIQQLG